MSRSGYALLRQLDLEWLAAPVGRICGSGACPGGRRGTATRLRGELRSALRIPRCATRRVHRGLEQAYRDIWRDWCEGGSLVRISAGFVPRYSPGKPSFAILCHLFPSVELQWRMFPRRFPAFRSVFDDAARIPAVVTLAVALAGCGGAVTDLGNVVGLDQGETPRGNGIFRDSNVSGLDYESGELSGVTSVVTGQTPGGQFQFQIGRPVTFPRRRDNRHRQPGCILSDAGRSGRQRQHQPARRRRISRVS